MATTALTATSVARNTKYFGATSGQASAAAAAVASAARRTILDLPLLDASHQAARAREQDADKDEERHGVADARRQVEGRQVLDHAEEHAAEDGAGHRAEAAEHGCREAVDGDEPHLGGEERHGRDEHAGDGAD